MTIVLICGLLATSALSLGVVRSPYGFGSTFRFARMAVLFILLGVALLYNALNGGVGVFGGASSQTVDPAQAELLIRDTTTHNGTSVIATISCPSNVPRQAGRDVVCIVSDGMGHTGTAVVYQPNADALLSGPVRWNGGAPPANP